MPQKNLEGSRQQQQTLPQALAKQFFESFLFSPFGKSLQ
jgi:hypothetical protein